MAVVRGTIDTSPYPIRVPVIQAIMRPEPIPSWRQMARAAMARTLPRHRFMVDVPYDTGSACLTFDDGPHPVYTPRILDILSEQQVTATFFVIGEEAEKHPDLVRRIANEGHVIGNHTWTHCHPGDQTADELIREVERADDLICGLVGECPRLFRPPMGKLSLRKFRRLWKAHKSVVLWSNDPKDFACGSPYELRAKLTQQQPVDPGDIVLMHDNKPFAAEVLSEVIDSMKRRGIAFASPANWLA